MNISHVELPEGFEFPEDLLGDIFDHQAQLALKYGPIENHPGWPIPRSEWDSKEAQTHLKDFAQRCAEELAEMHYAEQDSTQEHAHEELGDALHFLTEMSLITDYDPQRLAIGGMQPMEYIFSEGSTHWEWETDPRKNMFTLSTKIFADFIIELFWGTNHLKAKRWKINPMPTDWVAYHKQLDKVWVAFACLAIVRKISEKELYLLYFKKNAVNHWRVKTLY